MPNQVTNRGAVNAPKRVEKETSDEESNLLLSLGVIAAVIVGLVVIGGVYWALGGGAKPATPVATDAPPPAVPTPQETAPPIAVVTPQETAPPPAIAIAPQPAEPAPVAAGPPEPVAVTPPPEPTTATPPEKPADPVELTRRGIDPRVIAYTLPSPTFSMAYDAATGRVALTDDKRGGIAFYEVDQLLAGKVEPQHVLQTQGPATAFCFKTFGNKRYFVAASKMLPAVSIYDADTFAQVAELPIKDTYVVGRLIISESAEDPYVCYAIHGRSNNLRVEEREIKQCARIDLRTMKEDDNFKAWGNGPKWVGDGTISPDGSLLYYRSSGRNVTDWHAARYDDFCAGRIVDEHTNTYQLIPDAFGNAVSDGTQLYARDFRGAPKTLEFEPRAYFHAHPVIVAVRDSELVFGSSNDFRKLTGVPMPPEWLPTRNFKENWYDRRQREEAETRDFRQTADFCRLSEPKFLAAAADDGRKLAIVAFKDGLVLAPLEKLSLPEEPSLTPHAVAPFYTYVDQPISVPLDSGASGATFEVVSFSAKTNPPVVEGGKLKWSPSHEQVGTQRLVMRAKQGNATHEWEWPFQVEQPAVDIPFLVTGISVEPTTRKQAVVWGYTEKPGTDKKTAREYYLGTVDLVERKLTSQRKLNRPVTSASMSTRAVYAIAASGFDERNRQPEKGKQLGALRLPDLQPDNHVEFPSEATGCAVIADRYLMVTGNGVWRYKLPELKLIEAPIYGPRSPENYRRVRNGWLWDGVYWDDTFKTPQLLSEPVYFGLFDSRNDKLAEISNQPKELPGTLAFDGGYATIALRPPNWDGGRNQKPESLPNVHLISKPGLDYWQDPSSFGPPRLIDFGNDCLAATFSGKLYVIPFSHFGAQQAEPLHFELTQSTMVLNPAKPTRVKYEAKGATQYTLELRTMPNITQAQFTATSKDGSFSIDLKPFSERVIDAAVEVVVGQQWQVSQRGEGKSLERLQDYLKVAANPFREITKHKPTGVPTLLYASIRADGNAGETATLHHSYLVEIPTPLVRSKLEGDKHR